MERDKIDKIVVKTRFRTTLECPKCGHWWRIPSDIPYETNCPKCGTEGLSVYRNFESLTKEQKDEIIKKVTELQTKELEEWSKNDTEQQSRYVL